ncbi:hypothetical protein [Chelativorans sp. YIM 93263]|uniref:hypothetical protein n=1 Tax=Chelativorans sp. YIM 93263 TaxID=2906648 RepID=UPI002377EB10|nr:hypothetical protein [Chelativorans sp. YIM 93263]
MANEPGPTGYHTGTATIAQGDTLVTFQDAGNLFDVVKAGDNFGAHVGQPTRIASLDMANSQATLAYPWSGPSQTAAPYEIAFSPYIITYRQAVRTILGILQSGNVSALAGLAGEENTFPYFTGPGTMGRTGLSPLSRTILGRSAAADMRGDLDVAQQQDDPYDATAGRGLITGAFGWGSDDNDTRDPDFNDALNMTQIRGGDGSTVNTPFSWAILLNLARVAGRNAQLVFSTVNQDPPRLALRANSDTSGNLTNWFDLYHTGNAVGSVSRSNGIPTGALFESGSGNSGWYVRYADGTQICGGQISTNAPTSGSSSTLPSQAWPANFATGPYMTATIVASGTDVALRVNPKIASAGPSSHQVRADTSTDGNGGTYSISVGDSVRYAYTAIGRWY